MVSFGEKIDALHLLCQAHGIQLCICDVLYKKKPKKSDQSKDSDDETESESDDEEEDGNVQFEMVEEEAELKPEYELIIKKVRKCVNKFRRSKLKNGILQDYVKKTFGRELKLAIDNKTRWTSMRKMLCRFLKCREEIKKALRNFNIKFDFSEDEITTLKNICDALEPLEVAVKALCRRDATLLTAEKTITFTMKELEKMNNDISQQLLEVGFSFAVSTDLQQILLILLYNFWYLQNYCRYQTPDSY